MFALVTSRAARQSRSLPVAIAVVVVVSLVLIGSSSGSIPTTAVPSTAPEGGVDGASAAGGGGSGIAVTISGFVFAPASTTVRVGDMVTWTNKDSAPHTVTALNGSFDSGPLAQGAVFGFTFRRAGTFIYRCTMHPYDHGAGTDRAVTVSER
jgi:plastocyanin